MRAKSQRYARVLVVSCAIVLLGGCATNTRILDKEEINKRASTDFESLFADAPAPGAIISLPEAIARALKYNLDNRLKMMEGVVAQQRLDLLDFWL